MLLKDALSDRRIILGSASPRRKELLAGLGLSFTVEATPGAPETYSPELRPDEGREDAVRMLRKLSGRTHRVVTGVCIRDLGHRSVFSSTSEVEFKPLSDEEINYYIDRYRPFDKAGGYGIQEWIGYIGITSIRGSYFNIVGLPVQRLYTVLSEFIGR